MQTSCRHFWEKLRSSFWFTPGFCVGTAILLAVALLKIDEVADDLIEETLPKLTRASPSGVRALLSTAGTAVLTLAGLAFSGTLVALSLASGQFGPRLLRNFIRSRTNQLTLGILLGTFVYCLVVLREVDDTFIPHLAALGGFILSLCALAAFIFFVHSIVSSIQAERVVADVYEELDRAVERFFPDALPSDEAERKAEAENLHWEELDDEQCVTCKSGGYLQAVDLPGLVKVSDELDIRMRVLKRPGQFVHTREELIAYPGRFNLDEEAASRIRACFLLGRVRTAEQDFEFFVRQLVEVALRALSPGINDPFTAIMCIEFLSEALVKIARRRLPHRTFSGDADNARLASRPASFQNILDTAFLQIRQAGTDKPDIVISLLENLGALASSAPLDKQKAAILQHVETIADSGIESSSVAFDRQCIEDCRDRIREICE